MFARSMLPLVLWLLATAPALAAAQEVMYASAGVSIGFAPAAEQATLGRGVTIGFAPAADQGSLGRGVTVAFQNATTIEDSGRGAAVSIAFSNVTDPRTQLGRARNSAYNADPVNTATGNYIYEHTDISVPGRGIGLAFSRFYNSLDGSSGPLGRGWTHNYHVALSTPDDDTVQIRWGDGHVDFYAREGSTWVAQDAGNYDTLTRGDDGTFTVVQKSQTRWRFGAGGTLSAIVDRNGNTVALTYSSGRLISVAAPGGRSLEFEYDGSGRITSIADALPRTVRFAYDAGGGLQSITDPDGNVEQYTYDANGQMLTATDPRGAVYMTNTYDAAKRVVTWQSDAKGNEFQFEYNEASGETRITDPFGQVSVDAHDVLKRLVRQTDRLGRSVSYTYNEQNNRTSVTDQNGNTTTYSYDTLGNVLGKIDPLGQSTAITYDAQHNPLTRTDEAGHITRFVYDDRGNVTSTTDPLGHVTTMTYDTHGQLLTMANARGGVTAYEYDDTGDRVAVTGPTGGRTTIEFDGVGRQKNVTDARGHTTRYTVDGAGRVLTVTNPLGHVVQNAFDPNGNLVRVTDARGAVTTSTYDANNLLTTVTDALGGVTGFTYDALDRRVSATDARGKVTTFAYDAEGRLVTTTDPLGQVTRATYDGVGNQLTATDAAGRTTTWTYDALNRAISVSDPLGNRTRSQYDPLGRVRRTTDAEGRSTSQEWDAAGRLLRVTDAAGGTVQYTYDALGNRLTVTDPNGNTTTHTYDAASHLVSTIDPLKRVSTQTWDVAGNRVSATDPKGATLTFGYDAANRLISMTPSTGGSITFTYDAVGRRTSMADAVGTSTYTYDALGRVLTYRDAFGQTLAYEYDAVGQRTALVYPDGKRVSYTFDDAQRLTRATDWGGRATAYGYSLAGEVTSQSNHNGTTSSWSYDTAGRLTSLVHRRADNSPLASDSYTLDAVGNRMSVVQQQPLEPKPEVATASYGYDGANQIQAGGTATFTSDANGNLTARTDGSMTTAYAWDVHDRLTQVTDSVAGTTQYVYNGAGTRIAQIVNGVTTRFVVDPLPELSQVLVETDAAGTARARYVHALGLVSRVDASETVLTYHFDPRGSTVAMTNGNSAVVNSYGYDEFGGVRVKQESVAQPFQYVGQFGVMQEANGLIFMRARYYEPEIGRFVSADTYPAPEARGQALNRFAYVENNPVSRVDPTGWFFFDMFGTAKRVQRIGEERQADWDAALNDLENYDLDGLAERDRKRIKRVVKETSHLAVKGTQFAWDAGLSGRGGLSEIADATGGKLGTALRVADLGLTIKSGVDEVNAFIDMIGAFFGKKPAQQAAAVRGAAVVTGEHQEVTRTFTSTGQKSKGGTKK